MSEQIQTVQQHLEDLVNGGEFELNHNVVNRLNSLATADKSLAQEHLPQLTTLLQNIIELLVKNIDIDYAPVVELLDAILSQLDFETILSQFDLGYLLEALSSPNENLKTVAIRVIKKADPVDLLANTEIVPRMTQILADDSSSVKVVSEIENAFERLFSGELIRRRVLSDEVVQILMQMKYSKSTTVKSRLLTVLVALLPRLTKDEFPQSLCTVDVVLDQDILYTLSVIKFYTDLVDIVDSNMHKEWLMREIEEPIVAIASLYSRRRDNPDVELFAVASIQQLFKKVSYVSPEFFMSLDEQYIQLSKNDTFLLATLNPSYLATQHPTIIKSITLTIDTIPIYRHLITDPQSFTLIQPRLTSSAIIRLPYLEIMALTSKLSEYEHSADYLLNSLPQVMNKLLKGDNVVETETWRLRRTTLENLLHLANDVLGVWHAAVQLEYDKIVKGKSINPTVEILDDTM